MKKEVPQKEVLLIANQFPPQWGGGTVRATKLCKYLPRHGWKPVVLTLKEKYYAPELGYDESQLGKIRGSIELYRTDSFKPPPATAIHAQEVAQQEKKNRTKTNSTPPPPKHSPWRFKIKQAIKFVTAIPDAEIYWYPKAVKAGRQILKERDIKLILSTAPAFTNHLIGRKLQKISGLPWIADYRDILIDPKTEPSACHYKLSRNLENKILKESDRVVFVTRDTRKKFWRDYPQIDPDHRKFNLIRNGFDPDDFDLSLSQTDPKRLNLLIMGRFEKSRNPKYLAQGLALFFKENPKMRSLLHITALSYIEPQYLPLFKENNVDQNITIRKPVPHREAIEMALRSDALILFLPRAVGSEPVPTKFYEYLPMKKPIFAIAPRGETTELVSKYTRGYIAEPDSPGEIASGFHQISSDWEARKLQDLPPVSIDKFSYPRSTQKMAQLFKEVITERSSKP
jgi:glycosyltransferase involved in cell wall biosynthesis